MSETLMSDNFSKLEEVKQGTEIAKEIIQSSNINPQWVKIMELGDSILGKILNLVNQKRELQQEQKGVTNPNTSNVQPVQQQKISDMELNIKMSPMIEDLFKLIEENKENLFMVINENTTFKEILENKDLKNSLNSDFIKDKIKTFLIKHSEIILK